jgi:8-oxo-dGTP pyrophosphatase MutT (NUDIX family)
MRRSHVAYVLIRLHADGEDCVLLHRHSKWGDWTLVGGHVEADEEHDWLIAAAREAGEELAPLRLGGDFEVERLRVMASWGPEPSRSAFGEPTEYSVEYFLLRFKKDPRELLAVLPASEFRLVPLRSLETRTEVSRPVRVLLQKLGSELNVMRSWEPELHEIPGLPPN